MVASDALRAGSPDEREHAFGVRAARQEVAQEIQGVGRAEVDEVEQAFGFVAAAVHVADDDRAAAFRRLGRHGGRCYAAPSLARLGMTTMPCSFTQ